MAEQLVEGATEPTQDPSDSNDADIKARLAAQISAYKAAEAAPGAVPSGVAPVEAQVPQPAPQKAQPDAAQPKVEAKVDPDVRKEERVNENLEKTIADKETRIQEILRHREELKKKLYAKGREAAEIAKAPVADLTNGLTPELKKKFADDLEKDAVEALYKMAEMVADSRYKPAQDELNRLREEGRTRWEAERLDSLGQAGQTWVYTPEGQAWFHEVFEKEPALTRMSDPYGAAIRLYGHESPFKEARRAASAQAAPQGTPVLGVASAVPPAPLSAPVSPEKKLTDLNAEMQRAIMTGDIETQKKIGLEMRRFVSGLTITR